MIPNELLARRRATASDVSRRCSDLRIDAQSDVPYLSGRNGGRCDDRTVESWEFRQTRRGEARSKHKTGQTPEGRCSDETFLDQIPAASSAWSSEVHFITGISDLANARAPPWNQSYTQSSCQFDWPPPLWYTPVSYTHLRAHETRHDLVC